MEQSLPLEDYLIPLSAPEIFEEQTFNPSQLGYLIDKYENQLPDLSAAALVLLGVEDFRGGGYPLQSASADAIRKQLYPLYHWHTDLQIADLGNLKRGKSLKDTQAALRLVLEELLNQGKTVFVLGGSHDLTLTQYQVYASKEQIIEATVVDALIDLHEEEYQLSRHFLMEMLTGQPNFIKHYNHIGFQSYFVHPRLLETLDKLRFDFYRLGVAREMLGDMEPVIRSSDLFSFDLCALRAGDAPSSRLSPNGFSGEEACALFRYAGMSTQLSMAGLFGYIPQHDRDELTAIQAAQMVWYFIDGRAVARNEADLSLASAYNEFHISFDGMKTIFRKSKRTGRWWLQLPNGQYIPCAYGDYLAAGKSEIPERWLRAQERL